MDTLEQQFLWVVVNWDDAKISVPCLVAVDPDQEEAVEQAVLLVCDHFGVRSIDRKKFVTQVVAFWDEDDGDTIPLERWQHTTAHPLYSKLLTDFILAEEGV